MFNHNDIDAVKIKYSGETADRLIKQCMIIVYKSVVYKFVCPGFSPSYTGKTGHTSW